MKKNSAFTEYFQLISAMGKHAMWEKKAKGEAMHQAPLGYRNVRENGRSVIVPDPATFHLVEEARLLRSQGRTLKEICKLMMKKGLRSRRGNVIKSGAMDRILKRPCPSSLQMAECDIL